MNGCVAFGHYWPAIIFKFTFGKVKIQQYIFRKHDRFIKFDKMMEGEVSKIRNTLLQVITFLAKDMSSKTPVPDRKAHYSFDH